MNRLHRRGKQVKVSHLCLWKTIRGSLYWSLNMTTEAQWQQKVHFTFLTSLGTSLQTPKERNARLAPADLVFYWWSQARMQAHTLVLPGLVIFQFLTASILSTGISSSAELPKDMKTRSSKHNHIWGWCPKHTCIWGRCPWNKGSHIYIEIWERARCSINGNPLSWISFWSNVQTVMHDVDMSTALNRL